MECPTKSGEGPELFIAYAAQTLSAKTEAALERHCKVCTACRECAAAQKLLWSALDAWEPERISAGFDGQLYARIAAEDQRLWPRRIASGDWSLRPAIPVAAACAVLLAGYFLRAPVAEPSPQPRVTVDNRVDMEQVERALDDIDMLHQMGVVVPAS